MIPIFVAVNGYPQSGKDTFVDICSKIINDNGGVALKYSTITTCKEIASYVGWSGAKTPESRVMLSELKDWYTKHFDGTFHEMVDRLNFITTLDGDGVGVLFAMVREPPEITKIITWCQENYINNHTVLITGRGETNHGSHSDTLVEQYPYTTIVENKKGIDELRDACENFCMGFLV